MKTNDVLLLKTAATGFVIITFVLLTVLLLVLWVTGLVLDLPMLYFTHRPSPNLRQQHALGNAVLLLTLVVAVGVVFCYMLLQNVG